MRNADELDEQWRDLTRRMGRGRIRYAYGGVTPRSEQPRAEPWAEPRAAELPVTAPHADLWVLVCGGIAAAAAFAAAFVASGGVAAHASTPPPAVHTVVVQACPTAAPGR